MIHVSKVDCSMQFGQLQVIHSMVFSTDRNYNSRSNMTFHDGQGSCVELLYIEKSIVVHI